MVALPGWCQTCKANHPKPKLILRDVATQWNSTYDVLRFAIIYQIAIDSIMADKSLKLHKFELDNDDWKIMNDLASVLEVCAIYLYTYVRLTTR